MPGEGRQADGAAARELLREKIRAAGVVGAGGGGFPAHVKYRADVGVVIANGAECEPLSRADQEAMARRPAAILRGLRIAAAAAGATRGVVALKKKHAEAVAALSAALAGGGDGVPVELFLLDDFYPAGDEFVLVREVAGRVIPELGLPLAVGAVVSNVATLVDVAAAVDDGAPVTHRSVAVMGEVASPGTFRVPVGATQAALVEAAGGAPRGGVRLVIGGPMMGSLAGDPPPPVTKTQNLLLVLPEGHPVVARRLRSLSRQVHLTRSACLKCMLCTEVCPRNALGHRLYPDRLMRNVAAGVAEDVQGFTGAWLCSECGLCAAYGCVMGLDPCAMNRAIKQELAARGAARPEPSGVAAERVFGAMRRVPTKRLVYRLGVDGYDVPAPTRPFGVEVRELVVPLRQHAGAPAIPVVKEGQAVKAGELLGEIPEGKLGARVHAGLKGRVRRVTADAIAMETE